MTSKSLATLEHAKASYGEGCAAAKLALLAYFEHRKLRSTRAVMRLHEVLCFLRAYPDDEPVLTQVERMLGNFDRRPDLRRHRVALADSGIAGTAIHYRFFWSSAAWLARRWPDAFVLDRGDAEPMQRIAAALVLLVTPAESVWLRDGRMNAYQALDVLRGTRESDAAFLVRRVAAMPGDARTREAYYDAMDAACVLRPGRNTPSRTLAGSSRADISYRKSPLRRSR